MRGFAQLRYLKAFADLRRCCLDCPAVRRERVVRGLPAHRRMSVEWAVARPGKAPSVECQETVMQYDEDQHTLLKNTLAVVLAGGKGSRLEPLTRDRAKPAVPFGGS